MAIRLIRVDRDTVRIVAGDATGDTMARLSPGEAYARVPFEVWQRHYGQEVSLHAVVAECAATRQLVPEARQPLRRMFWPSRRSARWWAFLGYIWSTLAIVEQVDPWISRATGWPVTDNPPPLQASLLLFVLGVLCLVGAWALESRRRDSGGRAA